MLFVPTPDVTTVPPEPAVAPVPGVKPEGPYSIIYDPGHDVHVQLIWADVNVTFDGAV
jgi:hypothetical protein